MLLSRSVIIGFTMGAPIYYYNATSGHHWNPIPIAKVGTSQTPLPALCPECNLSCIWCISLLTLICTSWLGVFNLATAGSRVHTGVVTCNALSVSPRKSARVSGPDTKHRLISI